ncbi:NUDIX hydrolase [Halocatena halophila]|uniref:NUDIX hydrolase n=1 Tax=Halocatena halophila TaxID=2814576 RepID=UPI002ED155B2
MVINDLWYLAERATTCAESAYHTLKATYEPPLELSHRKHVSRRRFRTLARRITETGAPYGSQTIVYRTTGEMLLVRHDAVELWVLPGGELDPNETFVDAAKRELKEEAGIEGTYDGLAMLTRIEVVHEQYSTWGVLPIFLATAQSNSLSVTDPDEEISEARWFATLPDDTRDRADLLRWRAHAL